MRLPKYWKGPWYDNDGAREYVSAPVSVWYRMVRNSEVLQIART